MSQNDLDLVLVNIFHRHGERSPLKIYNKPLGRIEACTKNNSIIETLPQKKSFFGSLFSYNKQPLNFELVYKNIPTGECAPGQLTDFGKRRLYEFGKRLQNSYVKNGFINKSFDTREVHLTSTDFQRTIESLQSLIKGLFVSSEGNIPIHIGRRGIKSSYSSKFCPSLLEEKARHREKVVEKHKNAIQKINDYVANKYPVLKMTSGPYEIYDIICSNLANGNKFFRNFDSRILELTEKYSLDLFYGLLNNKSNLINYRGGILKDLYERLHSVKDRTNNYKMYITSGHDVTIYPLLMAFNIDDGKWPDFGANIIIETLKDKNDNKHYVRVKYNEKPRRLPKCARTHPKDKTLCSLDDFLAVLKKYVPNDRETACKLN